MQAYRIEKIVGEGSFGKALLCLRKVDSKKCIIKQISLSKMGRKEALQTEQEARLLSRLNHPNIVTFWESFQETTQGKLNLYIVMEFADGGDLSNLIQSRKNRLMSENQVLNIAVQISLALKHVHDRKILHRDLKSQNIFLTSKGIVKLGDFGIARVLRNTGELASTQIGTPYFMSPEILAGKRYNNKTDIWSLGCVIFELMALKVPFQGTSMKQLVSNIMHSPLPSLSSQYNTELRSLVKTMLAKDYKERPSINTILSSNIMREKIGMILTDQLRQREFCHTVLHGDDIFRGGVQSISSQLPHQDPPIGRQDFLRPQPPIRENHDCSRLEPSHRPKGIPDPQALQIERIRVMKEGERRQNQESKSKIQPARKREPILSDQRSEQNEQRKAPLPKDLTPKERIRPIIKPLVPKRDQILKKDIPCVPAKSPSPSPKINAPKFARLSERRREDNLEHLKIEAKKMELSPSDARKNEPSPKEEIIKIKSSENRMKGNWFKDLEIQMGLLKNKIQDLQSPGLKGDNPPENNVPPHLSPPSGGVKLNQYVAPKSEEKSLKLRKQRRQIESENLRQFVKAQRQAKVSSPKPVEQFVVAVNGPTSPSEPFLQPSSPLIEAPILCTDALVLQDKDSHGDIVIEQTPAQKLRSRRDQEREELRKMIAEKRKEKNCKVKERSKSQSPEINHLQISDICTNDTTPFNPEVLIPKENSPTHDVSSLRSSFFKYSGDHEKTESQQSSQDREGPYRELAGEDFPTPPSFGVVAQIQEMLSIKDSSGQEVLHDIEYDDLFSAMKNVIDVVENNDEEFEEESVVDTPALNLNSLIEEVSEPHWHSIEEGDQETLSNDSWDEFEDIQENQSSPYELTVFGVPFPLSETIRLENGLDLGNNTPASRMEALREFLENVLGIEIFIKVYRLLKSVDAKDDDDELLSSLETILGVERLHYMDAFIQLINIEDKFESGE